jgi:hypothetical protein
LDANYIKQYFEQLMIIHDIPANECIAIIERPMINPTRFKASISAARSLEATQIIFESLGIPYMFIDSREWQKAELPKGYEGPELKKASMDIGCRLFPDKAELIKKHKDADGLLIAHYAYKSNF